MPCKITSTEPAPDAEPGFPVAHVHWALPPVVGGVETYLSEVSRLTAARGHPVIVFAGKGSLLAWPSVETRTSDLLSLDWYADHWNDAPDSELAQELADQLRPELVRLDVKVVHGHNLHYFTPVPAMALNILREELGVRLHHTYHSIWADPLQTVEPCRTWEGHHVLSDYMRGMCASRLRIGPARTYPGIACDRYSASSTPNVDLHDPLILLPARLSPGKGAELALEALARLLEEGLSARLVLTCPEDTVDWNREGRDFRTQVDQLIDTLDLRQRVCFRSATFSEMPQLYALADVVVYPTVYPEPFGLAPLEAAAAGRPVVVSRVGGLPETVDDEVTGFVVPVDDVDALTKCIRILIEDADLATRMGAAGRERVRTSFSLDDHVDRMLAHYRRSLTAPR